MLEYFIGLCILIGIGLGGDYLVGYILLVEFFLCCYCGILLGVFSVVWIVGYVLVSIVGYYFIFENLEVWCWLLVLVVLFVLLIMLLCWGMLELLCWLLCQGCFVEVYVIVYCYFGFYVLLGDEVVTVIYKYIKILFFLCYWWCMVFNSVFFVCFVILWFVIYIWLLIIVQIIGLEDVLIVSLMFNVLLIVGVLLGLVLMYLLVYCKFLLGSFLLLVVMLVVMVCLFFGSLLMLLFFVFFSIIILVVSNLVGILFVESFFIDICLLGVGFVIVMS